MNQVRGIRNNNPANIRIASNKWVGKVPENENTDGEFEQFERMEYGVRALFVLLKNYHKNGFNTVRKIINRYAPPHENDTQGYVNYVASESGLKPDSEIIYLDEYLYFIARAILSMEVGEKAFNQFIEPEFEQWFKMYGE